MSEVSAAQRNTLKATGLDNLSNQVLKWVRKKRNSGVEDSELLCNIAQVYRAIKVLETTDQSLTNNNFEILKSVINGASQ